MSIVVSTRSQRSLADAHEIDGALQIAGVVVGFAHQKVGAVPQPRVG
jgi:hypothetical protein